MKLHLSLKKFVTRSIFCATLTLMAGSLMLPAYAEGSYTVNGEAAEWAPTDTTLPSTSTTAASVITSAPKEGGNSVEIDAIIDADTVVNAAYTESNANVSDNELTVSGDSELKQLYGGYVYHVKGDVNGGGNADRNTITVSGSTVSDEVKAGYVRYQYGWAGESEVKTGSANNNRVTVTDSSTGSVAAGHVESGSGSAVENSVVVTNSSTGSVTGGSSSTGKANNNSVSISGNSSTSSVTGGSTSSGLEADNNTITVADSSVSGKIYGGYQRGSSKGSADNNTVSVQSSSITGGYVYGGYAKGNAAGNTVELADISNKVNYVRGGYSEGSGVVENNSVTLTNSAATYVHGGNTNGAGSATNNTVTLTNSSATYVYGGSTNGGNASNNTVTLDGCTMLHHTGSSTSKVFGGYNGYGSTGTASNNTVILKGASDLSGADIYGGSGGVTTGNTLQMEGLEGSVNQVLKFDTIEQTGGNVTINSGKLEAAASVGIKGEDTSNPAVLASGSNNGNLSVKGGAGVSIENASLEAAGNVTIHSDESIVLKNTAIYGSNFSLSGEAGERVLDGVTFTLTAGSVADLRNSILKGDTSINVATTFTMMASSEEAVTVLLEGSTLELSTANASVSGTDGNYTISSTALAGLNVEGDFTMDLSALAPELSNFNSIEVQLTDSNAQLGSASDVSLVMNGTTYKSVVSEDGSSVAFTRSDAIPEPTTATLSLLALAALAARRRRR